jgi:hypothetical protein
MSLSSAEGQGRRHKTCTEQFFTKSRGLLNIKIDATLHLIGPNTDFVATFDHTDTEQITIAIHKIRLIQQLEEVLNTLLSFTKWKKCCTKSDTQPALPEPSAPPAVNPGVPAVLAPQQLLGPRINLNFKNLPAPKTFTIINS